VSEYWFKVQSSRFKVQGSKFKVQCSKFKVGNKGLGAIRNIHASQTGFVAPNT